MLNKLRDHIINQECYAGQFETIESNIQKEWKVGLTLLMTMILSHQKKPEFISQTIPSLASDHMKQQNIHADENVTDDISKNGRELLKRKNHEFYNVVFIHALIVIIRRLEEGLYPNIEKDTQFEIAGLVTKVLTAKKKKAASKAMERLVMFRMTDDESETKHAFNFIGINITTEMVHCLIDCTVPAKKNGEIHA